MIATAALTFYLASAFMAVRAAWRLGAEHRHDAGRKGAIVEHEEKEPA